MTEPTIHQLFDLTGRTALVTGGTGYLGTAFGHALAEAGATVVLTSRYAENAATSAAALPTPQDQQHRGIRLDQTDPAGIAEGFNEAVAVTGTVDIMINNGLDSIGKDLTNVTYEEFTRHQANNAAYFELARLTRDHAVQRSAAASIVNIGSMYGQVGSYPDAYEGVCGASPVAYHALKGGTIHMTRHLAVYWAKDNVRVNCLSPGAFPNPESAPGAMIERLVERCPMKRMGIPSELKGAIVFLASDASAYMTGQNMTIDGGWTAW